MEELDSRITALPLTICGGSWKGHITMIASFKTYLEQRIPNCIVFYPYYEMICGGVVAMFRDTNRVEFALPCLEENYSDQRYPLPIGITELQRKELIRWME
jgi:hypothetical protein